MGHREKADEEVSGAPRVRFEPPDIIAITLVENVTEGQLRAMFDEIRWLTRGSAGFFELVDLTRVRTIESRARRFAVQPAPPGAAPVLGAAIYGANFHLRVLSAAMHRALRLFGLELPLAFFGTRAEAEAWIDARRSSRRPRGGATRA